MSILFLHLPADEKAAAYPGDAPPYTGAPSSYGVEMGQPVRVQAPHQVMPFRDQLQWATWC